MTEEIAGRGYFARRPEGMRSCSAPPMSKEKSSSPDPSEASPPDETAKRRAPKSRARKQARTAAKKQSPEEKPATEASPPPFPVFDQAEPEPSEESSEPSSSGEAAPAEKAKRKRRRKKGKGSGSQQDTRSVVSEGTSKTVEEPSSAPSAHKPKLKLDSEAVAKLAWKIYLAEVSEEGVALIGDSDAKELSHRCFRLAEIFMEEQARRS